MKKKLFLVLSFCLFAVTILTGCGVEGSSSPNGIKFTQSTFYVDLGVNTHIDYKVYPSTAKNYEVSYSFDDDYIESRYYTFKNGWIKVTDKNFTGLDAKVTLGEFQDTARIKLREYPTAVSFENASEEIYSGAYKILQLSGVFKDGERNCDNGEFNYQITSSNSSVIEVVDSGSLVVKSTGRRGSSSLTVKILNSLGEDQNLSASITLTVQENISQAFATIGDDLVVRDGQNYTFITHVPGQELEVKTRYFDADNFLVEGVNFNVITSGDDVVKVKLSDDKVCLEIVGDGDAYVTIQSDGVQSDGLPYKITFKVTVQIS